MRRSLTREERLRSRGDIQRVFRRGRSYRCKGVSLKIVDNGLNRNRALVVPPRKSGTKARKNRLRRVGKEAYRHIKPELVPGHDLVFVVYPGAERLEDRIRQFRKVLGQAGLLNDADDHSKAEVHVDG